MPKFIHGSWFMVRSITSLLLFLILPTTNYQLLTTFAQQGLVEPPVGAVDANNVDIRSVPQLVVSLLFGLAIFLAVVYLIYGGIKWITSRGDKVGVEAARKHIIAAIVGLVVVAGTFLILQVVFNILGTQNPLKGGFTLPTLQNPNPGK